MHTHKNTYSYASTVIHASNKQYPLTCVPSARGVEVRSASKDQYLEFVQKQYTCQVSFRAHGASSKATRLFVTK